jgi:hypothetical protein
LGVLRGLCVSILTEHAVVSANDLVKGVAQGRKKVAVGIHDGAIKFKLNDRLGPADGLESCDVVTVACLA